MVEFESITASSTILWTDKRVVVFIWEIQRKRVKWKLNRTGAGIP
jgi:hypothetical protein